MRVRLLSPYPLIVGANGRPIDPPAIVELPDALARALEAQSLLEAAPGADITAEATVLGQSAAADPEPAQASPPPVGAKEEVDLDGMTKAELVAYAKAEFDLDLDAELKKAELIALIEQAAKKA